MEKVLKLYTYVDGVNDTPFPSEEEQIIIGSFTYTANRMGSSPTITATVKHRLCLDDVWTDNVYAEFNEEKYFIRNTPSSSKSNGDTRYEHDLELLSEREVLNHVYFIDAVQGDSDVDVYKSNSTKVQFFGDIKQFVERLNSSLSYSHLTYTAVVDEGITTEDKQVTFENQYIIQSLQTAFETFNVPFYFVGKTIHFGYTPNAITTVLKYGHDDALLSISKQNANYQIINRITGTGSTDNIPYYYPNDSSKGELGVKVITSNTLKDSDFIVTDPELFATKVSLSDKIIATGNGKWEINGEEYVLTDMGLSYSAGVVLTPAKGDTISQVQLSYITPSQNLMPSIYRESKGTDRFYNAKNDTYDNPDGGKYAFENEYYDGNPLEGITAFDDIKPSIAGVTNASGQRIDSFLEFAYDRDDNDETDEEGNYIHPYFFAKLRKTDGDYGFNLFDQAIEQQAMQISFTSGICGACTFEIGVGEDTQKNLVQVGPSGALLRDENGNVRCGREGIQNETPQDRQNDTRNYEVWIALKKDNTTYPQVMPNVNYNYKPSTEDTFVILGINLPKGYILKAEKELDDALIKYMWENNVEKFTFSAKFSRIFFEENPYVLSELNENARVMIEYNGIQHTLYIDQYTYKMESNTPLPEIEVNLVDTLNVGKSSLQNVADAIRQDIINSMGGMDILRNGLRYFIRKDVQDTARGKITFIRGIDIGSFSENTSGGTFRPLEDGTSYAEVDRLRVRLKAYFETLEIINTNSVGGKMILTAGGGVYLREVKDRETVDGEEQVWDYYRCYFLTEQDGRSVENRFKIGDLAISQSFNIKAGVHQGVSNHYYWREVVGVGDDYVDLSKSICDTGSDAPMAEDTLVHLGNRTDKDRQGAIMFSSVDVFSPSIILYYGINDFSLTGKEYVSYGVDKSSGNAFFRVYGEFYAGDREQTSYVRYTPGYGVEMKGKFVNESGENISDILTNIQDQIDGAIETWFYDPEPTLDNEPAVNWTTDDEKNNHLGDLYYSGEGKAYRFQKNENNYEWHLIQDTDITKALAAAQAAQEAAEQAIEDANEANDRLNQWASDGVISPTEKQAIKDEIARIDADKENINNEYTKYTLGTPSAFNNAYTTYRALLVSLSASEPENISIPSDFATKQETYYTARTTALGVISDASKELAETANATAIQAQQTASAAAQAAQTAQTTADSLKNFTDTAFADGIIDRSEAAAIEKYINTINETKKSVDGTYDTLIDNEYFDNGTVKTALTTAYNELTSQISSLLSTINTAISDNIVTEQEKNTVNTAYGVFSDKVKAYDVAVQNANKQIQDKLKGYSDEALQQANAAMTAANEAKQSAAEIKNTVDDMRDFTDEAFADGIISMSEAGGIASYINNIETFAEDVEESYQKVYNNPLLSGTDKTNLGNAYTAFNTAKDELLSAINTAISDNKVDTIEKANVDGKYSAFNTKYGDFIAYINAATKFIQDVINRNALDALDKIGELDYLKAALKEYTTIEGGLIQSSTLALGYTSDSGYNVMAGTSGIYDASKLGGGIASWWGGAMFDRFEYTEETMPSNVAKGVIRMDGTGYLANGNLWWEEDGTLHADPLSFFVGPDQVGNILSLFQFVESDAGIEYVIPQYPFHSLDVASYVQIGNGQLCWDEENKAFYVRHKDGTTSVGFYATNFISAKGLSPSIDIGGGGASKLSELEDVTLSSPKSGQSLVYNGSKWVNTTLDLGASDWSEITGKPSVFATDIAQIGDLHSSWDALLKAAKPATLAGYGITDAYTKTDADGRYVLKTGDIMTGTLRVRSASNPYGALLTGDATNGYLQLGDMTNNSGSHRGTISGPSMTRISTLNVIADITHIMEGDIQVDSYRAKNNGTVPTTVALDSSAGITSLSQLNLYKSFLGTVLLNGSWNHVISLRHRNGYSDGDQYGMYLRAVFGTDSSLGFNIQHNGTWGAERMLLDNANYASTLDSRYVKKSGDTMTGVLTVKNAVIATAPSSTCGVRLAGDADTGYLQLGDMSSTSSEQRGVICGYSVASLASLNVKGTTNDVLKVNNYTVLNTANYASALDGRYVKKSGDTMTGALTTTGLITTSPYIYFGDSSYSKGRIGLSTEEDKALIIQAADNGGVRIAGRNNSSLTDFNIKVSSHSVATINDQVIWTAGNDGSGSGLDADTVDGVHNGNLAAAVLNSQGRSGMITGKPTKTGLQMFDVYGGGDGYPVDYGNLLRLRGGVSSGCGELLLGWSGTNNGIEHIYYRNNRDMVETWSEWRTVAFTTDNVASATKLQTARTIWGQSFDGRANVSGNMTGVGSISASGNIMTDNALFQIDATNILDDRGLNVLYNGQRLFCGFGMSGTKGLYINHSRSSPGWVLSVPSSTVVAIAKNSGINVGIGTESPTSKLHVSGDAYASGYFKTDGWFQNNTSSYGLYNSPQDARWYASGGAWNTDKPIIPKTNNTQQVGTSSYRFNYGYFTNMNVNGLTVNGNSTLSGNLAVSGTPTFTKLAMLNGGAHTPNDIYYSSYNTSGTYCALLGIDGSNYAFVGTTEQTAGTIIRGYEWVAVNFNGLNNSITFSKTEGIYSKIGVYSDGYISALGNNTSSDMRLKTKLSDIALTPKDIANAPAMLFAWKKNGMKDVGSSAQYWKNVLPDAVKERDGWLEMAYGNIALVSAISIAKKVVSHEERIAQLEKENIGLKNKIKELERRV